MALDYFEIPAIGQFTHDDLDDFGSRPSDSHNAMVIHIDSFHRHNRHANLLGGMTSTLYQALLHHRTSACTGPVCMSWRFATGQARSSSTSSTIPETAASKRMRPFSAVAFRGSPWTPVFVQRPQKSLKRTG